MLPSERLKKANTIENLWIYALLLIKETPNEPIYAWQIPNLIEKKFGFMPGRITPYRVLYRLESEGFVKSRQKDRKRVYQITDKGIKELEAGKNILRETLEYF